MTRRSLLTAIATPGLAAAVVLGSVGVAVAPEVYLTIKKGLGEKIILALPSFNGSGGGLVEPEDVAQVLSFDIGNSGYFSLARNQDFVDETEADDRRSGSINFQEWLALGAEVLVKGEYESGVSEFAVEGTVYDLAAGRAIFARRYSGSPADWRKAVHRLADDVVNQLTGERGIAQTKIAFVSNATGTKEVYAMDYDGEARTRVTKGNVMAMYPDWFPGGQYIVYTRQGTTRQETCTVNLSSGTVATISRHPGLNAFAAVSPRGNEILLTLSQDGNPEIYRMNVDGSEPKRLTHNRSTESSPCWSPDGRRLAFVSDRAGSPQIYVMSVSGGVEERATYEGSYNTSPDWSPKGTLIAYTARIGGVYQVCTVDVTTKEVRQLTTGSEQKEDPSWAPDGRHLVYSGRSRGKSDLFMLDIYELKPLKLTSGAGDYLSPAWSD
jgi:TolB protein